MSYQVLARKWRPNDFSEVVGQEHVVQALTNALDQNKIHQAYVLSGTRGVGKTTIARILSKSLNCEKGLDSKPCHKCATCTSIAEGSFMDFLEIDAASSRGVDDTKQLLETVIHMPSSSRYKVYLLDEVHMLSTQSFNMLLKTLEEPPEHVIFILATTLPEKIPATVLSRCLQFNLKNLTPSELIERISFILKEEKVKFEVEAIEQISRAGRGSLRDCLTIADQAIAYCDGKLTEEGISQMLGTLPSDYVNGLLSCIAEKDSASLLNLLKEISGMSIDYPRLMDLILETIQLITFAQVSEEVLNETETGKKGLLELAQALSADDLQILYQIGLIAKRDMELAPSISSGFEMALLRMVAFLPGEVPKTKKKIESIKSTKIPETKEVEEKTLKEAGLTEKNQESLDISAKSWNAIFNKLKLDAGTKQLVSHCSFLRTDDSIVYLSMPEEKLNVFNGKHRQELQDCLTKHFNQPCNVFLEAGEISEESPNKIKEKDKRKIQDQAEKAIKEDPKVQNIIETFGAKVVESSIEPRNS
ncbi:MAG TPA: DNA polymerase III subunit gamma/tau [SAR86 cluster bacterium]|mgnify:FL=1|nr:DNA polymerase III subunit gamma/tau [SAR86 cluster bacterium]